MNDSKKMSGAEFEKITHKIICEYFNTQFHSQIGLLIGQPPKKHKFDFVSTDNDIVVECKCYTFTESGNNPSAKISTLNEAIFYMSFLPATTKKYLAIKKSYPICAPGSRKLYETLAEYYVRLYHHFLRDVKIVEVDTDNMTLQIIN